MPVGHVIPVPGQQKFHERGDLLVRILGPFPDGDIAFRQRRHVEPGYVENRQSLGGGATDACHLPAMTGAAIVLEGLERHLETVFVGQMTGFACFRRR